MHSVKILSNGANSLLVNVTGIIEKDMPLTEILRIAEISHSPRSLKFNSVTFALQEKLGVLLYWKLGEKTELILPVESRGKLDFESVHSLHSPREGLSAIAMSTFGCNAPKAFTFTMDFTKQS
jgi:hypothetical protein